MKYKGFLASLFMATSMLYAVPGAQASKLPDNYKAADVEVVSVEAFIPNPAMLKVSEFMKKSSEDKGAIIVDVVGQIMEHLKSPNINGNPKPEALRQEHLRMAYFIDNLFFNKAENGDTEVDEAVVNRLLLLFRAFDRRNADATVERVIGVFLEDEYQKYKKSLTDTPRPDMP